ncbi:MAG TPA: hypothetical protein VFC93_03020 [Chloroflexota bacterium]|nr:hypothetical protein [Chloroflexota bacterium]
MCGGDAIGRCRDCRRLYCRVHGRVLCEACRRSHRVPMTVLAAIGTFPTATCALTGVVYKALNQNVIGVLGVAILVTAALLTIGAMVVVWRHPEGIAHAERFE